jgi:hypothetical protein
MTQPFQPVTFADLITHDAALDDYPWLSAQIISRWRKARMIRVFSGRQGKQVYARSDLERAFNEDFTCDESEDLGGSSNIRDNGSDKSQDGPATTDIGMMTEADALSVKRSLQLIYPTQKTNSSKLSPAKASPPKPRARSISSTPSPTT